MSSVAFRTHRAVDGHLDQTIEHMFRALGEYSGIHSFDFDDELEDDFATLTVTDWEASTADATWSISSNRLQGTGGGTAQWYWLLHGHVMPDTYVLEITKYSSRGAVAVLATDTSNLFYVSWSSSNVKIGQQINGSDVTLCQLPKTRFTGESSLTISVQEEEDGYYISAWFDEKLEINAYAETEGGTYMGFGVYESDTTQFDDLRVPELTDILAIATLDVGETPLGALERALGRRHINYFVRWDGTLRAWRPKAQTSAHTFAVGDTYVRQERVDRRSLVSHVRQIGAWDWADAYDQDLLEAIGHRFAKDENPDLMTESQCQTEADQLLVRTKEYAHQMQAEVPTQVFLEPEDRITLNSDSWIVSQFSIEISAGGMLMQLAVREYTYG